MKEPEDTNTSNQEKALQEEPKWRKGSNFTSSFSDEKWQAAVRQQVATELKEGLRSPHMSPMRCLHLWLEHCREQYPANKPSHISEEEWAETLRKQEAKDLQEGRKYGLPLPEPPQS